MMEMHSKWTLMKMNPIQKWQSVYGWKVMKPCGIVTKHCQHKMVMLKAIVKLNQ